MSDEKNNVVIAYKGFDKNLQCRGYQYEIGNDFEHKGTVKVCENGFHACRYPLDVFEYYVPADSRFATVELSGDVKDEDHKTVASKISIKAEVSISGLVKASVDFIMSKIESSKKESNTGDQSAATNTGNWSAATNTGNWSAATNTGDQSAAEVSGLESIACGLGINNKARASKGGWIVLAYRDDEGKILHIKTAKVGTKKIKQDVWYKLDSTGKFEEVCDENA